MANLTIIDARKMSNTKLDVELGKCAKKLEELGMNHVEACDLLSTVMNIGIASQEKIHNKK